MLLAAVVPRGRVDVLLEALRGLRGGGFLVMAYRERGGPREWRLRVYEGAGVREALDAASWLAGGSLGVYALCGGVHTLMAGFTKAGFYARTLACSLRRLGRQRWSRGLPRPRLGASRRRCSTPTLPAWPATERARRGWRLRSLRGPAAGPG
ncbi:hypothetical protein [Pyrodictium occultum]|uniref:hypothetical protein n=1 Tax=Pyrodictium occultum TaxID=2309 RepID=UPI00071E8A70|nr:hypothetical protein [Pyrodictium occultum]